MANILDRITTGYLYVFEQLADQRMKSYFLMGSPVPVTCLVLFYFYFVLKLGPQLMENRKPFRLEKVIIVYNVIQIVACLYLVVQGLKHTFFKYSIFCEPINYSNEEHPVLVAKHVWVYFMLKVFDLLDTVFFVLRKKNEHLSFLHVYHHAGMVVVGWFGTKYLAGGHGVFVGFLNCIVHMVMYFYYLLSVWDEKYKKNIWWKKHITQMQMIQFMILVSYFLQLLVQPNCTYPKWTVWAFVPQNIFMLILFTNFYIKTYVNTPELTQNIDNRNLCKGKNNLSNHKIKTQ